MRHFTKRPAWPFRLNRRSPQAKGLFAWWPVLRDGLKLRDLSGRGSRHGTLTNGPTYAACPLGGVALSFDGTDDQVVGPLDSNLASVSGTTWTFWVKVTASTSGAYLKVGSDSDGFGVGIGLADFDNNGNDIIYLREGVEWHVSSSDWVAGWNHCAVVHNSAGMVYVNGVLVLDSGGTPNTPTGSSFYLGGYEPVGFSRYVACEIADVRFYSSPLSAMEIQALYDPATRWELYHPLVTRRSKAAAVAVVKIPRNRVTQPPFPAWVVNQ
jgi:hypothetical protein